MLRLAAYSRELASAYTAHELLLRHQLHSPLTVSTPLSTTAFTLALNALFVHSTSKSSNHTLATHLSNLISIPGTGIPKLWSRLSSCLSAALRLYSLPSRSGLSSTVPFASLLKKVEFRGTVMGLTASSPNCASRKRKRRARRVEGSAVRWGWGCLKRWDS